MGTGTETGLFLDVSVSERVFFEIPYRCIMQYTDDYSVFTLHTRLREPQRLEILQTVIEPSPDGFESYRVVVKTFWLRLVQRRWKRIYQERQHVLKVRTSWQNLRYSQLRGRHLPGYNIVPGILWYDDVAVSYFRVNRYVNWFMSPNISSRIFSRSESRSGINA